MPKPSLHSVMLFNSQLVRDGHPFEMGAPESSVLGEPCWAWDGGVCGWAVDRLLASSSAPHPQSHLQAQCSRTFPMESFTMEVSSCSSPPKFLSVLVLPSPASSLHGGLTGLVQMLHPISFQVLLIFLLQGSYFYCPHLAPPVWFPHPDLSEPALCFRLFWNLIPGFSVPSKLSDTTLLR